MFVPFAGTVAGAIVGAAVGPGPGGRCGLVLLGHDRAAVARDVPAVAVPAVAVTTTVVHPARDPVGISAPLVALPSLTAPPSAWFAGRHVVRRLADPVAADPAGPSRPG